MTYPSDDVTTRVVSLFGAVFRRYARESEAAAAALDLTPLQAKALLATTEPVPMRTVAERLHAEPSNLTAVVDKLEERGLVERRPAPTDRRVKLVVATATGQETIKALRAAMPFAGDPLAKLDPGQRQTLCQLLELMSAE